MHHLYQILQSTLRIEQHLKHQSQCSCCCRSARASLPSAPSIDNDTDDTFSQTEAASFLIKSEKQVYRYRVAGRLPSFLDANGQRRYRQADLERLFKELWGYPKGGFKR